MGRSLKNIWDTNTHRGLQQSITDFIRIGNNRFVTQEAHLGSATRDRHCQRADVYAVTKSHTKFFVSIYEIKVSRSDLLSDINSEKWCGYLEYCNYFYFATIKGIATKDDIPSDAGWVEFNPDKKTWTYRKQPKKRDEVTINKSTLLGVLFSAGREEVTRSIKIGSPADRLREYEYADILGKTLARKLNGIDETANELNQDRQRLKASIAGIVNAMIDGMTPEEIYAYLDWDKNKWKILMPPTDELAERYGYKKSIETAVRDVVRRLIEYAADAKARRYEQLKARGVDVDAIRKRLDGMERPEGPKTPEEHAKREQMIEEIYEEMTPYRQAANAERFGHD